MVDHLIETNFDKLFPAAVDEFPSPVNDDNYIDAWLLNSVFSSLTEIETYLLFYKDTIEAPLGVDILGADGSLIIDIPAARYPSGLTASARDSFLLDHNIKKDVTIFGVEGSLEGTSRFYGTFFPRAGSDDGFVHSASTIDTASAYLSIGAVSAFARESFIRLPFVNIPAGATVINAFLRITAYTTLSDVTCNTKLHLNDIDDAVAPSTYAAFMALALTPGTAWNALPTMTTRLTYDTPDIKDELQHVIARDGWESGHALMIVIKNNGSSTNARRAPSSYNQLTGDERPELYVTWSE